MTKRKQVLAPEASQVLRKKRKTEPRAKVESADGLPEGLQRARVEVALKLAEDRSAYVEHIQWRVYRPEHIPVVQQAAYKITLRAWVRVWMLKHVRDGRPGWVFKIDDGGGIYSARD